MTLLLILPAFAAMVVRFTMRGAMDRRNIIATTCFTLVAGAVAAFIGYTALPDSSLKYQNILFYGGIGATILGTLGLAWLFRFEEKRNAPPPILSSTPIVSQSATSIGQSGGQTAHTIHNTEPQSVVPRSLSAWQVEQINAILAMAPKGKILTIQYQSKEQSEYNHSIERLFVRNGWEPSTLVSMSTDYNDIGFFVSTSQTPSPAALAAIEALKAAGITFSLGVHEQDKYDFSICTGMIKMNDFQRAADKGGY
jgi:hypothetical protein